jgi:hypothetical protein
MKPRRFPSFAPAVIALFALMLIPCLGCVGDSKPYEVNPFAAPGDCSCPDGACPCPDGSCPGPNGTCPDGSCPGGQCPAPNQGASGGGGTEISSDGRYEVNQLALFETKTGAADSTVSEQSKEAGRCPTCPPQFQPLQIRPAIPPPQTAKPTANPGDQVKTGAFRCEQCKRPTVGRDWKEIWADDGTSLMCMCQDCYGRSSPAQREQVLRSYAARSSIDLSRQPAVESAIKEAAFGF